MVKDMYMEAGIDDESMTNKSGQTTCVTRMTIVGVSTQVGMQIIGHKLEGTYKKYDRSIDAQV